MSAFGGKADIETKGVVSANDLKKAHQSLVLETEQRNGTEHSPVREFRTYQRGIGRRI